MTTLSSLLKIIASGAILGGIIAIGQKILKVKDAPKKEQTSEQNDEEFTEVFDTYDYDTFVKVCKEKAAEFISSKTNVHKTIINLEGNGNGLIVPVIYYRTSDGKVMKYELGKNNRLAINISEVPEEVINDINSDKKGHILASL